MSKIRGKYGHLTNSNIADIQRFWNEEKYMFMGLTKAGKKLGYSGPTMNTHYPHKRYDLPFPTCQTARGIWMHPDWSEHDLSIWMSRHIQTIHDTKRSLVKLGYTWADTNRFGRPNINHPNGLRAKDAEAAAALAALGGSEPDLVVPGVEPKQTSTFMIQEEVATWGVPTFKIASRLDLISPELITALGTVLEDGVAKYGERDWENNPTSWGFQFDKCSKHLRLWRDRKVDGDMSHLWMAAARIMFLIAYEARGIGEDDRPGKK